MRKTAVLATLVLAVGLTAALDAEAKRLGGGRSSGMQRQAVTAPAAPGKGTTTSPGPTAPNPGSTATVTAPAAPAAAAPARRSWMGPLAGLAAGLGIAALASHFGLGEALANLLTVALVAMAAMALVAYLLRKRLPPAAGSLAGAGGPSARAALPAGDAQVQDVAFRTSSSSQAGHGSLIGARLAGRAGADAGAPSGSIPAGFDTAAFERTAREQFIALQAANDARDLGRLREVLTPEMFGVVRAEIAERGDLPQATEVFGLQAQVLDVAEEADHYVVSVRFTGSIREQAGAVPDVLDETWHLVKPRSGAGGWVIGGIQQAA